MKSIKQMRKELDDFCSLQNTCSNCPLDTPEFHCGRGFSFESDNHPVSNDEVKKAYGVVLMDDKNDSVNHPSHYNKGKIEVADFIADQKLNFDRGNAVKYVCRAGSKDPDKEIQDLEKAIWYINHEIKMLKGDITNGTEEEN